MICTTIKIRWRKQLGNTVRQKAQHSWAAGKIQRDTLQERYTKTPKSHQSVDIKGLLSQDSSRALQSANHFPSCSSFLFSLVLTRYNNMTSGCWWSRPLRKFQDERITTVLLRSPSSVESEVWSLGTVPTELPSTGGSLLPWAWSLLHRLPSSSTACDLNLVSLFVLWCHQ